jgi:HSP20 family protein
MFSLTPWKKSKEIHEGELVPHKSHPLAQLRDEFDQLFDRFLTRWAEPFGEGPGLDRPWALDLEEGDQEVVVKAEVPGFEPNDLDVQVSGNVLTVKAEHKEEKNGKEGNGGYAKQCYRSFRRSVSLPPGTDPDRIEAHYKNGLLEVHLPRSEHARGKRIPVKT